MTAPLPDPPYLGLPEKFSQWRPHQAEAVCRILDTPRRFSALVAPTGFGKTPVGMAAALLGRRRTAFLTSTKGLQTQLNTDFSAIGLVDVRGQQNYLCRALQPSGLYYGEGIKSGDRCDAGPCHVGAPCTARFDGCYYFDTVREAQGSQSVVTNYAYWVMQHRYSESLGKFDMLICDEAHDAPDELAQLLEVEIWESDVEMAIGARLIPGETPEEWKAWAGFLSSKLAAIVASLEEAVRGRPLELRVLRELHFKKSVLRKLEVVATMEGDWVIERRPQAVKAAPVWPGPYAEKYLFLDIPHVVLMSATVQPKTLELLGVSSNDMAYDEYPSSFPSRRRPVRHVPTVRVQHSWSEVEQKTWVRRIDQILGGRLDRKGIIHTGSYERRNLILTYSEYREILYFNDSSNTRPIVDRFRQAEAPAVLVSPSLTTGWDLPYEECEYAIIGKIPFPDTRSEIVQARTKADADYGPYCAMQTLVQAAGRGMRSADDQCEILIVDDNWMWFWKKFKKFAPQWFIEAVDRRHHISIPDPLAKLQKRRLT
jgi:Rad3-related DNA helicase